MYLTGERPGSVSRSVGSSSSIVAPTKLIHVKEETVNLIEDAARGVGLVLEVPKVMFRVFDESADAASLDVYEGWWDRYCET